MGFLVWVEFFDDDEAATWENILVSRGIDAWCNEDEPNIVTWKVSVSPTLSKLSAGTSGT